MSTGLVLLDYLPLCLAAALLAGLALLRRLRARGGPPGASLVQLRAGREPPEPGAPLALAGLGFALALALALVMPAALSCMAAETCPEGPALWVSVGGLSLLGFSAALVWPAPSPAP